MTESDEAWRYLGQCLRAERGGRSRAQIEAESGVSASMIQKYEGGKVHPEGPPDKLWQLARYYRWTPDSLSRVLEHRELPRYLPEPPPLPALQGELRDKVTKAIEESPHLTDQEKRDLSSYLTGSK